MIINILLYGFLGLMLQIADVDMVEKPLLFFTILITVVLIDIVQ